MRLRRFLPVLLGLLACVAHGQTLYGPGGLIINPTAYADPKGLFQLNASFFNRQLGSATTTSFYPVSATYAFTDQFELGGVYLGQFQDPEHQDRGGVFFKQGLRGESRSGPALALVGASLSGGGNLTNLTMIASKEVVRGVRLHAGFRGVNNTVDNRLDGNAILGTDFSVGGPFRVIAEGDTRLHFYPVGSMAYGLQYRSPGFTTTVGAVAQGTKRFNFFVGIGFPINRP